MSFPRFSAFVLGVFLSASFCGAKVFAEDKGSATKSTKKQTITTGTESVSVKINGMTCGSCSESISNELKKIDGIESLSVSHKAGEAKFSLKEGVSLTDDAIKAAIKSAGYEAVTISRTKN